MQTYYYDTTKDNQNNSVLGYITQEGDFINITDYTELKKNAVKSESEADIFGSSLAIKIMAADWVYPGPLNEFYEIVRKAAIKFVKETQQND